MSTALVLAPPKAQAVVGIIYPPPEVRTFIDTTARYVARNGRVFEERIRASDPSSKFAFLDETDPYHAYYVHMVTEFQLKGDQAAAPVIEGGSITEKEEQTAREKARAKENEKEALKDPPAEPEFTKEPATLSAQEVDVVKLTAQFVAKHGKQFLRDLMRKEAGSHTFDFLLPQHGMFSYFVNLVEQYARVLSPSEKTRTKLRRDSDSVQHVLERIGYRARWNKHQEAEDAKRKAAEEDERLELQRIDWHDFAIVELVDFHPMEGINGGLPAPVKPEEVGARVIAHERWEKEQAERARRETEAAKRSRQVEQDEAMDVEMEDAHEPKAEPAPAAPQGPAPAAPATAATGMVIEEDDEARPIRIVRDYDPRKLQAARERARAARADEWLISPLTGEKIRARDMDEHLRIELLDPRWREQKERAEMERNRAQAALASGGEIEASLRRLAKTRTDIFGREDVVSADIADGKEESKDAQRDEEKITWDGYSDARTTAARAAQAAAMKAAALKAQLLQQQPAGPPGAPGVTPGGAPVGPAAPVPPPLPLSAVARPAGPYALQPPMPPPLPGGVPLRPPLPPFMLPEGMPDHGLAPPPHAVNFGLMHPARMAMIQEDYGAPMAARPPMGPVPFPPDGLAAPAGPPGDDGGAAKRARLEEEQGAAAADALVPEGEWEARYPGPIAVVVVLPQDSSNPKWQLDGRRIALTVPVSTTVGALKEDLQNRTGMPPGRQKLMWQGTAMKNTSSLAAYNVGPDAELLLGLKERGGR